MTRGFLSVFRIVCGFSLLALPACQTGSANVSVHVEPETAEAAPLTTRAFSASVHGTSDRRVTWSVIGPGSVSPDGLYTAPSVIPPDSQNLIRVVATSVTGKTAEATVRIIPVPLEPTRGPTEGGTIVRITGEGFVPGTAISFGGVDVPSTDMTIESEVLIRAKTPARPALGPADLEILVPGREPLVYPEAFHYGATRIQMEGANLVSTCYRNSGEQVLADVTGDGKLDMVTACYDGGLSVYSGDGAGAFAPAFSAAFDTATDYPYGIAVGDLEGDGDTDFFVVGNMAAYVYRNEGGGAATFVGAVPWDGPTYGYTIELVAADLTGDGRADLAYSDYNNDRVCLKINDGTGVFGPVQFLATQNTPYDVIAVNVDGDTDMDLVAAYYSALPTGPGGITVMKNDGSGTFALANYPIRTAVYRIGAGDFDDDGDQDIIAISASLQPAWIRNSGTGIFSGITDVGQTIYPYNHYHQTSSVGTGDLDGDGITDAFVQLTHQNQLQVFYGVNLTGLAGIGAVYDTTSEPYTIAAADVTGDGMADLLASSYDVSEIYDGQGTRQFGPPKVLLGASPAHVGLLPKTAGSAVALVAHPSGGPSLGSVSFVEVSTMLDPIPTVTKLDLPATSSVGRVHAADVTGDGIQDVLAVDAGMNNGGKGSVWLLAGIDGTLYQPAVRVVSTDAQLVEVSDIAFADLDSDGRTDLVVSRHDGTNVETSSGVVQVLWGNARGGFEAAQLGWEGITPNRLAIADLDDDGLQEILVTDYVAGKLAILTVSGRSVVETAELDVGDQPLDILVADFDRDYVKDVAVMARYNLAYSIEIDVFHGLGYLTWDLPERYRFYGSGYGLVYGDIDGDELEDLAVPINYPPSVAVLRGHDGGRFLDPELALVPGNPIGVSLADIDGDSLIDLIVADSNTMSLRPLANRSK